MRVKVRSEVWVTEGRQRVKVRVSVRDDGVIMRGEGDPRGLGLRVEGAAQGRG